MKKIRKEIQDKLDLIPIGAVVTVFDSNILTKWWGKLETHHDDIPTHTAIYLGNWEGRKNVILEACKFLEFNELSKHLRERKLKIAVQWFPELSMPEGIELYHRIIWFSKRKLFYDVAGYAGFFTRLLPFLSKIFKPSDKLFFCSELAATIYEGDKDSKHETIKKWGKIRTVSSKPTPTGTAPVDIFYHMFKNGRCKTMILKDKGEKYYE